MTSLRIASLAFVLCLIALASLQAQTITTLHSFNGMDGALPIGSLVEDSGATLYGTTSEGGSNGPFGPGTVFKITPDDIVITLHNFNGDDGDQPSVTLVLATDGNLYGTTWQGGSNNYGTIFKVTTAGGFTVLHSFTGGTDGQYPGPLIQASDGNFYGTAWGGADNNCGADGGCGVIFRITAQGDFTKIYQFQGSSNDGYGPQGIIEGSDGNFYGTALSFSRVLCNSECGSVFKVTPNGSLTQLHVFNGTDGNIPLGQLLLATDGNFYGTTEEGGAYAGGTVFKMTPSGALTSLYSFCSDPQDNCPDGDGPASGVMQASDGTLYGTTVGTIFTITPSGSLTTFYRFTGGGPGGRLFQASNGNF